MASESQADRTSLEARGAKRPVLGSLLIEANAQPATIQALDRMGHKVETIRGALWAPNVIRIEPTGQIDAAGDANAKRHAAAF
jgi:hypothetical protein